MSTTEIHEVDTTGTPTKTYSLTTTRAESRLDLIPPVPGVKKPSSVATRSISSFVNTHVAPLFLPHGYPHTVTPDYTPYQIYDSLQAFTSSIVGLLSSRAVLQSFGMDSSQSSSTSVATYATLLSVARSTISNLSSIFFADHMSSRVGGEVKFYRFLADILNDTGFLLEMISPSLPGFLKVPTLCFSSALKAMCGVAGGSSKAILSAHFALDDNIGELNAKDSSQETVINLIGMWAGGVVVSKVESLWATWCWMIVLLCAHLWLNWLAVTSVRLKGLNPGRAGMVLGGLIKDGKCEGVENIGRKERIFGRAGAVRNEADQLTSTISIGRGIDELAVLMDGHKQSISGTRIIRGVAVQDLIHLFAKDQYLLWYALKPGKAVILLKEGARRDDQLKAWCHAIRISHRLNGQKGEDSNMLQIIAETKASNDTAWQDFQRRIEDAGWSISATMLECSPGTRLRLPTGQ